MASALPRLAAAAAGGSLSSTLLRQAAAALPAALNAIKGARLSDLFHKDVCDDILASAIRPQHPVSLRYMLQFGSNSTPHQLIQAAQFLQEELPVRLAHRVADLEALPAGLADRPQVLKVRDWYVESFRDIRAFPPVTSPASEARFTRLLAAIYQRHRNVVPVMATGVMELKRDLAGVPGGLEGLPEIHSFLDAFYLSRIGIRMLTGQHLAAHEQQPPHHIGLINTRCRPVEVCQDAADDARLVCMREKGTAPEVRVIGNPSFFFPYVPSHLHHMVFELVKNSLRAVHDRHAGGGGEAPPIRVVVAEGMQDVTIKVSDEGGGIPRSELPRIWTYLYTTGSSPLLEGSNPEAEGSGGPTVLAGYGHGLPISRLYARYFGGELTLISMQNYGTDTYLHLNRLGNSPEPLP